MIFLGADRYGPRTGLYETLQRLAKGRQYESMLALTDDAAEVVRLIGKFEPEPFGAKMSHS
jgi:hypothetical protein